jgi:hypothetical protein
MRAVLFVVGGSIIAALVLAACGSSSSPTRTPASAAPSPAPAIATVTPVRNDKLTVVAGRTPAQAADLIARTVTGSRPLLFPNAIPGGWTAEASALDANGFSLRFTSPDGKQFVRLALVAANPEEPGEHTTQTEPNFHNDDRSLYQVQDTTDPKSFRWLQWDEPGTWGEQPATGAVPYYLDATGLTDAEFWAIANSLHPIQR